MLETTPPSPTSTGPSLRQIAARLGISHATVSLALRNDTCISASTRELVQRTAEHLGYRPKRRGPLPLPAADIARPKNVPATLAAITDHVEAREPCDMAALRFGAQRAAESLGYRFEIFRVRVRERRYGALEKMLRDPAIKGLLLLPMVRPVDLTDYLDWRRFPVVAATEQVVTPEFHRVLPDHFGNAVSLCERLVAQGHRRLGFVSQEAGETVAARRFAAAVHWVSAGLEGRAVTLSLYPGPERSHVRDWFDLHHPEAIVTATDQEAEAIAEELGATRRRQVIFALGEHSGSPRWAGIDHRHRAVGAAAVGQLHARIQAGETGVPDLPTTTTVKGEWVEAIAAESPAEVAVAI